MIRKLSRGGDSKIGCIFWLAIVGFAAVIAFRAVPIKINVAELQDFMDEQAKFAGKASAEDLKQRVLNRAKDLDLPVDARNLTVIKGAGRVKMETSFTMPIDLIFTTYEWKVELKVDRPVFIV